MRNLQDDDDPERYPGYRVLKKSSQRRRPLLPVPVKTGKPRVNKRLFASQNRQQCDTFQEAEGDGYRLLKKATSAQYVWISDYDPAKVMRLLAMSWAFPRTLHDVIAIEKGEPATITAYRAKHLLLADVKILKHEYSNWPMTYFHGCDIAFFRGTRFIDRLCGEGCFVSSDSLSLSEAEICLGLGDCQGVFMVHGLSNKAIKHWHLEKWKAFGCEARPHANNPWLGSL